MPDWIAPTKEPPSSSGPSALAEWKVVDDPDYNRGICLAGETKVLTGIGSRPIKELVGTVQQVLTPKGWREAKFRSFGEQSLMRISLRRAGASKEIFATPEHRWFAWTSSTRYATKTTLELRAGDRLKACVSRSQVRAIVPTPMAVAHGLVFGDGSRDPHGPTRIDLFGASKELLGYFPMPETSLQASGALRVYHLPDHFKERPDLQMSHSYLLGWLMGYFAADGCVSERGQVTLTSVSTENLEFVRDVATRLGVVTYPIRSVYRKGYKPGLIHTLGFQPATLVAKFFLLRHHRARFDPTQRSVLRWSVEKIEDAQRYEEVFCAVVEDGQVFTLEDNILTSNCIYEVIDLPNLGIRLIAKNLERKDAELIVSLYEAERTRHE